MAAPVKPLRHKALLLPSLTAAFLWHLGRITGRNALKGNKASTEPLEKAAGWLLVCIPRPRCTACVVSEEREGAWRCPRVRSCPLDLFFSFWRPSVSWFLCREFRDLLSGLTYLLTWHKLNACGRQPGSYAPFFSFFSPFLTSWLVWFLSSFKGCLFSFAKIGNGLVGPYLGAGSDQSTYHGVAFPPPCPTTAHGMGSDCHLLSLLLPP